MSRWENRNGWFGASCRAFALAALTAIAFAGDAAAGAWTLPKGQGQVILSALYVEAHERFDDEANRAAIPPFAKAEAAVYGEYGLFDGFTAIVEGNIQNASSGAPLSFDETRPGLGALGGRLRLWQDGGSIVSAEVTARMSPRDADSRGEMPFDAQADLRLLAGYGFAFGTMPAFLNAEAAYRLAVPLEARRPDRGDEIRLDLSIGLRPREDWLLLAQAFNAFDVDTGSPEGDRRSHKMQFSVVHDLSKAMSLQLGGIATVAGSDALRERGVITAVWLRF